MSKLQLYWACQIIGWAFYIVVNSIFLGLSSQSGFKEYLIYFSMLPVGIFISHFYRGLLIRLKVIELRIPQQLLAIIFFSVLLGIVFFVMILLLSRIFGLQLADLTFIDVSVYVLNFTSIFFLWNVIYFAFQYFQNYKRSEISALQYLAASRESELNNLKAQLNPHFIFNCMNSIRALIDESPPNAKLAVTRLSNMLRNTLLLDKSKEVPLKDELVLVQDYLSLEQIRYEERLSYELRVDEDVKGCLIPPFIIQSQVENAIKHGISKLPGKGQIIISAAKEAGLLKISVVNTGRISTSEPLIGVGFKNSIQRLNLLYGEQGKITISEASGMVQVDISIPVH